MKYIEYEKADKAGTFFDKFSGKIEIFHHGNCGESLFEIDIDIPDYWEQLRMIRNTGINFPIDDGRRQQTWHNLFRAVLGDKLTISDINHFLDDGNIEHELKGKKIYMPTKYFPDMIELLNKRYDKNLSDTVYLSFHDICKFISDNDIEYELKDNRICIRKEKISDIITLLGEKSDEIKNYSNINNENQLNNSYFTILYNQNSEPTDIIITDIGDNSNNLFHIEKCQSNKEVYYAFKKYEHQGRYMSSTLWYLPFNNLFHTDNNLVTYCEDLAKVNFVKSENHIMGFRTIDDIKQVLNRANITLCTLLGNCNISDEERMTYGF